MTNEEALLEIAYGLDVVRWLEGMDWHPFEWQREVLHDRSTRICINGARQGGKSTIISSKACHMAKYKPGSLTVILAPTQKQAKEDMAKIRAFYANDPHYPARRKSNDEELALANESRVLVLTASDDAARGYSNPDLVIFDEASRIADDVFDAVRPMLTGNLTAQIVEISTPNGRGGFFHSHFNSPAWSRYEVRSPWEYTPTDSIPTLVRAVCKPKPGIKFYISPRHEIYEEQLEVIQNGEDGHGMSERKYRQEYCCEFVEAEAQVFSNELIESLFSHGEDVRPMADSLKLVSLDQGESQVTKFESFEQWARRNR